MRKCYFISCTECVVKEKGYHNSPSSNKTMQNLRSAYVEENEGLCSSLLVPLIPPLVFLAYFFTVKCKVGQ